MKKTKLILPALVFAFAIGTAFTTANSTALVEVTPDHFRSVNACFSCSVFNAPGNIYGVTYGCDTNKVSIVRCSCVFFGILVDATTTGFGGLSCAPLWRYNII